LDRLLLFAARCAYRLRLSGRSGALAAIGATVSPAAPGDVAARTIGWRSVAPILLVLAAVADAYGQPAKALVPLPATGAPALILHDLKGKVHRLADYRGRVVLVNFWASWCEPCRDEMPSMQALARRLRARGGPELVILAVNYGESEARIADFLHRYPLDFPVLRDPFGQVWQDWKPAVLPASFLIDRGGKLRYRVRGEIDWTSREVEGSVRRLLQERPPSGERSGRSAE
jgi:cytochrome c biogenesis protein CcmG, thiol:disulfide interchange protein DsbE